MEQRYGQHVLDVTLEEIMPAIRPAPIDEPGATADHLLRQSELMQSLEAMFLAALARAGAFNSDEAEPDFTALAEEAGLSLSEYEVVAMAIDGHSREEIAKWQHTSLDSVDSARRRGVQKIRQYVLNSGSTAFSHVLYEGAVDADEA